MSVAENMTILNGYPMRNRRIDWRSVDAVAREAPLTLGVSMPPDRLVGDLSQAEKSLVAIARALTQNVDVLVLDEPSASLPEADASHLFAALDRLRARRIGIIYVTHRLDEVFRLADAVTVLRDGAVVATYRPVADLSAVQLVQDIVGKPATCPPAFSPPARRETALEVVDLCVDGCGPITFGAARGEILGLAGLRGQGHESLGRALAGIRTTSAGSVRVDGKPISLGSPRAAIAAGVGFASSKRIEESLATTLAVYENLFINPLNFSRGGLSRRAPKAERDEARAILARFSVTPANPALDVTSLSGGNQQKVVLARLIGQPYRLLVLEEPTMGVDIGAKAEIYALLAKSAAEGQVCIVVSSDLDELVQICSRVLAFSRGRVSAELDKGDLSIGALTHAISGALATSASTPSTSQVSP